MRILSIGLAILALAAPGASAQTVQYTSKAGVKFTSLPDTGPVARALAAHTADPSNVAKIIDLGLAQSAARQYREAIETFTRGVLIDSKNPLLYRWRGHRYISIGEFGNALVDLTRGTALDPTNFDILYHLGVAHFARGEFPKAADAFAKAQALAPNANEVAGVTDWLWMAQSRAKRGPAAAKTLAGATDSVLAKANPSAYTQRLKLYRGLISPDEAIAAADTVSVQVATISFGIGNWYLVRGDRANAKTWFEKAVASRGWPGFAFFLSEIDLLRLR